MTGPYNTPLGLAREPLMAFFWVILAPVLFLTLGAYLAQLVIPEFRPGSPEELGAYKTLWLFSCLAMALWFALMSSWSNWLGAGPFAGRMRTEGRWIVIALIAGPLVLLVPSFVAAGFMTEDGWQYRQAINEEAFAPANWTLIYIFLAVIMAPIVEEVTFRGVAFGTLIARGLSPAAAIMLSSVAFALIHMQYSPVAMFVVFISGIGFAILRLLSGTVVVPIIAHSAANANVLFLNWIAASPPT